MSDEVVEWINQHKLKGIGIDAPSFDPVTIENLEQAADELLNHRAILKTNHTLLLENLCNMEEIGNGLFTLCALPLYTVNADGAPARVIAIVSCQQ
jgi:kynurenine formamidase